MSAPRTPAKRPSIKEGDIVLWADGRAFQPDADWRRAINGIDRDAYDDIIAVYRVPHWTKP